jgi:hypothetical protein
MSVKIMRAVYWVTFPVSAAFFTVFLFYSYFNNRIQDASLVKSTALFVLFLVLYITKTDREYMTKSIVLRVMGFVSCISGLMAMVLVISKA